MNDPIQELVGSSAAETLAPEAGLFANPDPVLLGRALGTALMRAPLHPGRTFRATSKAWTGLMRAGMTTTSRALGASVEADDKDRRFADPAWNENFAYAGLRQLYEVAGQFVADLVEAGDVDGVAGKKAAFAADLMTQALAPTNFPLTNPAVLKRAFETGGLSLLRGARNFLHDQAFNDGMPRQVDRSGFELGENLAATPGKVVFRNDLMELIQYEAQTEKVHKVPLLCSPPWINKYYIMDLAPGRSFIEWAVQHGHTVFAISYRNPDASMRGIRMDDYLLSGPLAALDVITEITGEEKVNVVGLCLGGALTAMLIAYLSATGRERVNSVTLLNTLLDYSDPGPLGIFTDPETVTALEQKMERQGYLEASQMRSTFDMLRSNDLIFNYVVSNWLMGEDPPKFDILAWNADSTRMPAKMHAFYLRSCYLENELARGELELDGVHISLKDVEADVFLVGAENDHIAPWTSSYQSTQLLSGDVRFVLSSAGHIAGIVNPPSKKARYWTNEDQPADPSLWRQNATEHAESWWQYWADWMGERAGNQVKARAIGSKQHVPMDDAPGQYVRD